MQIRNLPMHSCDGRGTGSSETVDIAVQEIILLKILKNGTNDRTETQEGIFRLLKVILMIAPGKKWIYHTIGL